LRPILDQDTVQIELTNACTEKCSNCTRFVGHHPKPFFMSMEDFQTAVDSMITYPKMTGIMGGEPLLHPKFREMCMYLHERIPPERCGLWTTLPKGYEDYREDICRTFKHIFINDHTRDDIYHWPVLVSISELPIDPWLRWYRIDHCWAQMSWSASINPHGAFFCEIAASLSMLLNKSKDGWDVVPGWWTRSPVKDFREQAEKYCPMCGMAAPLMKRASIEEVDDISPGMYERLKDTSPKVKQGKCVIHPMVMVEDSREMAAYKDTDYRNRIANRYGMFVSVNDQQFWTPYLFKNWKKEVDNG
jgi:hypothetical protein